MNNNGLNDVLTTSSEPLTDELGFYVYSDVLDQMFACQTYKFNQGSVINFYNLEIPCKDYLIVILVE